MHRLCLFLCLVMGGGSLAFAAPRLRIGVENNSPPLSFSNDQGQPDGFTAELLGEMSRSGGIEFEIVSSSWKVISGEFEAGRLDVLANVVITAERHSTMDFSIGHASIHGVSYTRIGIPPIRHTAQFAGKSMATLSGTTSYLKALEQDGWGARIVVFSTWPDMLSAVRRGDCDFALLLRPLTFEQPDETGLQRDFVDDVIHQFHFAVHRGDAANLAVLNAALATVLHRGAFDRIYSKWIGPIEPHPIRLADLRPYLVPGAVVVLLLVALFGWQRRVNRQLNAQARALAESEAKFSTAFDRAPIAMVLASPQGQLLRANQKAGELFGLAPADLPTATLENFMPGEDAAASLSRMQPVFQGESDGYQVEERFRHRDGHEVWGWMNVSAVRAAAGGPQLVIAQIVDLTARKAAEEAWRESAARYRQLFEANAAGAALHEIICDAAGRPCDYRFLEVNPAFERVTALRPADLIGRTLRQVLPQADPVWIERYGRVALTGVADRFDQYSAELGRHFEINAYSPKRGQFAVLVIDVTAQKEAEQMRGKQLAELRRWHDVTLGREKRVMELKREVNQVLAAAGRPPRYASIGSGHQPDPASFPPPP